LNQNLLLSAVSSETILLSLVFIVATINKFDGIQKVSFEYGNLVIISFSHHILLSASSNVINSPKILDIFHLFISSIIR
jgi:hypothetical protein